MVARDLKLAYTWPCVREVSCPKCGAAAGSPCTIVAERMWAGVLRKVGEPISVPHMVRRRKHWGPGS